MQTRPIFRNNLGFDHTQHHIVEAFNGEEISWVSNLSMLYQYTDATVVGQGLQVVESIRKSRIKWIHHDDKSSWLYDKLADIVAKVNNMHWGFNLSSIIDSIQYTEYPEGGGHYDWHIDIGPESINHRKASIVVLLSDSSEYEGGDLQIWPGGTPKSVPRNKGSVIVFPSFLMHRVTPVTKGTRKSLVLWVGGDTYR